MILFLGSSRDSERNLQSLAKTLFHVKQLTPRLAIGASFNLCETEMTMTLW